MSSLRARFLPAIIGRRLLRRVWLVKSNPAPLQRRLASQKSQGGAGGCFFRFRHLV
jgi:hypothetical protein